MGTGRKQLYTNKYLGTKHLLVANGSRSWNRRYHDRRLGYCGGTSIVIAIVDGGRLGCCGGAIIITVVIDGYQESRTISSILVVVVGYQESGTISILVVVISPSESRTISIILVLIVSYRRSGLESNRKSNRTSNRRKSNNVVVLRGRLSCC